MLMAMPSWVGSATGSTKIKEISPKFNDGKTVDVVDQKLGYMVHGGDPNAIHSIVPMAFGNLALN